MKAYATTRGMSLKQMLRLAGCGAFLAVVLGAAAAAVELTWDADGTSGGGTGGSGTWNTSSLLWDNAGSMQAWSNAAGDSALFGGTAGTVTLGEAISASGLRFTTTGYTITADTLTLSGSTPAVETATGVTATIASAVAGSNGLTKTGAGSLSLSAANTFSGAAAVNAGSLSVSNTLRSVGSMSVASGATLELGATNMFVSGHGVTVPSSMVLTVDGGTLLMNASMDSRIGNVVLTNGATWTSDRSTNLSGYDVLLADTTAGAAVVSVTGSGAATMNTTNGGGIHLQGVPVFDVADTTGDASPDLTVSMALDNPDSSGGTGGFRKTGAGTMVVSAESYLDGPIQVAAGTLRVSNRWGAPTGATVSSGAVLDFENGSVNNFSASHGTPVADTVVLSVDGGTVLMQPGSGSRLGNVVLSNGATWTSNTGLSSYDNLLGDTSAGAATVTVNGSGVSTMDGSGGLHLQGVQNFNVADTTGDSGTDLAVSTVLAGPGATLGAAGGIAKLGAGTMRLTGANTFTAGVTVSAGTLAAANPAALGTGTATVASGAILRLDPTAIIANAITDLGTGSFLGSLDFAGGGLLRTSTAGGTTRGILIAGSDGASVTLNPAIGWSAQTSATASDIYQLSNTSGTAQVLSLDYDPALAPPSSQDIFLAWFDTVATEWVNAVDGNSSGTPSFFSGSWDDFLTANPSATPTTALGTYGHDTAANTVWAVIDHNSDFSVVVVPEPATLGLMGVAGLVAGWVLRRRRKGRVNATRAAREAAKVVT